jgi:copper transport protein
MHRPQRRRVRRWIGLAAALTALAAAPGASAHAELLETQPGNDVVVETTRARVSLRFNERVETAFGAVRVYDTNARRVDSGDVTRPSPEEVAVALDRELPDGTYTVTWRIVSADAHPLDGAFVFHVGAPGVRPAGIAAEVLDADTPGSVTALFTTARFLDFALLLLAVGGAAALVLVLPGSAPVLRRRLALVPALAAFGLVLVAAAGIVLQGAAAGGFGLGEALSGDVIRAVLETRFGEVWAAQAVLAGTVGVLLLAFRGGHDWAAWVALGAAVLLVPTPALAGHAGASGGIALVSDVVHVGAGAAWTGGLALLLLALVWAGAERWPLAASAVPRFSAVAVVSVAWLLSAGLVNGYLQVRTWSGLWETDYGLLLLAKVALVLPVLALGAYNNRRAVPRLKAQLASAVERRRFLRTVRAELVLLVAIVGVTAFLVAEPPARAEVAPEGPASVIAELGPLELNLVADPGDTGRNQIHLYLTDENGTPTNVDEATVSASLPSRSVGPLRLKAFRAGPGHFIANGSLALAGDWQLTVEAVRGKFESLRATVSIPIRKDVS